MIIFGFATEEKLIDSKKQMTQELWTTNKFIAKKGISFPHQYQSYLKNWFNKSLH